MRNTLLTGICLMLAAPLALAENAPAGSETYIIEFSEPGALRYDGSVDGLKATANLVREKARNKAENPDIKAYRSHLNDRIDSYANQMSGVLGRTVVPTRKYNVTFSGMAVKLTADEAQAVASMPGVSSVEEQVYYELDTDAGPEWIGAHHIWQGFSVPGGMGTTGENIVVGVLDTGVNMDHPSFSDTPEDGHTYVNPLGDGVFLGSCATEPGTYVCNNKLIGAWDFADPDGEADGPEDSNGHGSHTASTAAGNFISGPFVDGATQNPFDAPGISGVAPHANLITYDVCTANCSSGAILAAVDQAILDGVDVFNFSISGGNNPWTDNDRRFLDAFGAGILPVASAGNTSDTIPDPVGNVAHLSPWTMTVANQTHNRVNNNEVSAVAVGVDSPEGIDSMYGLLGVIDNFGGQDVVEEGIYGGHIDDGGNFEGCLPWTGQYAANFANRILLVSRGSCNFSVKIDNGAAAGASAVLVFNNQSVLPIVMGGIETTTIPSLMIGQTDGENLRDALTPPGVEGGGLTITMSGTSVRDIIDDVGSFINAGSLRGPNTSFDVTKPDLGGPGTNIFAAYADNIGPAPQYAFLSGTSMSSPHAAGAAALLMAIHPDWTPLEVKSALMMTARQGFDEAGLPADYDVEGSGTINLEKAALVGLVMDDTFDNMLAAEPAMGGDPATLNLPSLRSNDCNGTCSWTRTVCSTLDTESTWELDGNTTSGVSIDFTPTDFDLLPSGTMVKAGFEDASGPTSDCQTITYTVTITDQAVVTAGEMIHLTLYLAQNLANTPVMTWSVSFLPTGVAP